MKSNSVYFLLLVVSLYQCASAYSDADNLAYINKIIDKLNNHKECDLPSYNEVDELNKCYKELGSAHSEAQVNSLLSNDQKLILETLLLQWDSFQERMTSGVVIRSAKKRSFMCKIEDYQKAKYGFSVCTKVKDSPKTTDKVFEKNPIVRYVKHLETKLVPEPQLEDATSGVIHTIIGTLTYTSDMPRTKFTLEVGNPSPDYDPLSDLPSPSSDETKTDFEQPAELKTKMRLQEATDEQLEEAETESRPKPSPEVEEEPPFVAADEPEQTSELEPEPEREQTPELEPEPEQVAEPNAEKHLELEPPVELEPESELHSENQPELVETEEPEFSPTEAPTATSTTTTATPELTTTKPNPKVDLLGVEYVDDDEDDIELEKLVKIPPTDWAFDPIFGYFKWPDENPSNISEMNLSFRVEWVSFVRDPEALDRAMEQAVTEAPVVKPKMLSYKARRKQMMNRLVEEEKQKRTNTMFGWDESQQNVPRPTQDWKMIADNSFCKIAYNKEYMRSTGKKVKALMSSAKQRLMS